MYGKFALYQGVLGHFTFVLNAGAGVGMTRIELRNDEKSLCGPGYDHACLAASFGDTGTKFLGSVGAGFRVYLGERAAIRLEVRDLVYTARVDRINGCTKDDLDKISGGAQPAAGCNSGAFGKTDNADDTTLARALLKETSSDVLNNIGFYAGFSFLF